MNIRRRAGWAYPRRAHGAHPAWVARRQALRTLLAATALAVLPSCTSLVSRPAPVKRTFLLDPPLPQPGAGTPKPQVLRIGSINVAAPFRAKQFVYRKSELGYESDYYDEWFVPPGTMLADGIAKGLAAARVFRRVVPSGASGNEGDYLLDGFVTAFYGDVREAPTAELAMSFYLTAMDSLGSAPAWTHEYTQRVPMTATTPDALAQAQNAALGAMLRELARDLDGANLGTSKPAL
ncbi:MAG: ABC-type transport auxiliary lipoprotein family protein [Casimicrobiaceae bacterium]